MPRKPKKPCRYPGCPLLVEGTYCEEHQKVVNQQYNKYQRDDFTKNFYKTSEWLYTRKKQLQAHPARSAWPKESVQKQRWWTI